MATDLKAFQARLNSDPCVSIPVLPGSGGITRGRKADPA